MTNYHRVRLAESMNLDMEPPMLVGANMAVRRALALRFPWDEDLGAGRLGFAEDMLFWFQVRSVRARISKATGAPVVHHFKEDRLLRSSLLRASEAAGRSEGYLWHHVLHSEVSLLRTRLAWFRLRTAVHRYRNDFFGRQVEGAPETTLETAFKLGLVQQLHAERGRARKYERLEF